VKRLMKEAALGLLLGLFAPWTGPVCAQEPGGTLEDGEVDPWVRGVSREDRLAARELFDEGNARLEEAIFGQALESYQKALQRWNHPAIHYNMALALMSLDRPIEVHEHLTEAMRNGPDPLGAEKYENARRYMVLIEKQLARVEIRSDEPGARVSLDGQHLFIAPDRVEKLMRPGTYKVSGTKDGYEPRDIRQTLMPGEKTTVEVKLYTEEQLTRYETRWPVWIPWTVVGAGVGAAAGGGLLHMRVRAEYDAFDAGVLACGDGGCVPAQDLTNRRLRGNALQRAAVGAYGVGGVALVTGAVLLFLNQPKAYRIDPDQVEQMLNVAPLLGNGMGGAWMSIRF
jgi:hypothetical protein